MREVDGGLQTIDERDAQLRALEGIVHLRDCPICRFLAIELRHRHEEVVELMTARQKTLLAEVRAVVGKSVQAVDRSRDAIRHADERLRRREQRYRHPEDACQAPVVIARTFGSAVWE